MGDPGGAHSKPPRGRYIFIAPILTNCSNSVIIKISAFKTDADYFSADYLLVTNLFRDQLDRYGELDTTAKMIKTAIEKFKAHSGDFTVILNADDPGL